MDQTLKIILYPFSFLYQGITSLRNFLYNKNIFKSTQFHIPVIGVGNLAVGGTGKTPMVEFIIENLYQKYSIGIVSRGYGRKTRGFIIADDNANPGSIGDEPFQLYTKYGEKISVAVGEERVLAIPQLLYHHPEIQVILLDDAFQHRAVRPALQIMLTDYSRLFYKDVVMPGGRLRESRKGAQRADAIVVTKCPDNISIREKKEIASRIAEYVGKTPVFFSSLNYGEPYNIENSSTVNPDKVVLLSGIANPKTLLAYAGEKFKLQKHFSFSDHHFYTLSDLKKVAAFIDEKCPDAVILTTEKDATKLKKFVEDIEVPIYVLPVKMKILDKEAAFLEMISNAAVYKEE